MQEPNPHTIKAIVLEKITANHVTPTSKWYFRAHDAALWVPGVVVTTLGSFAVAGLLYSAVHAGWEYRPLIHKNIFQFALEVIPVIWVTSLFVFGALIVKSLRMTAKGYRYSPWAILGISFVASIMMGTALFMIDMKVTRNALIRFHAEQMQSVIWTAPEEGRLAGAIDTEGLDMKLTDTTGKIWILDTTELTNADLIQDDLSVRVLGEQSGENVFLTCVVLPWDLSPIPHEQPPRGMVRVIVATSTQNAQSRCAVILESLRSNDIPVLVKPNERNMNRRP
jgi:hypothetical protein